MDLYSGGLITTIKNLETKIQELEHFLHSNHGLLLAAKRSLVHCYSQVRKLSMLEEVKHFFERVNTFEFKISTFNS